MLPFGVTIPATVPQRSEIPEGLMNYPVYIYIYIYIYIYECMCVRIGLLDHSSNKRKMRTPLIAVINVIYKS
jgi:hypothetical protein